MTQPNPFVEFVESYHQNPVAFVQQVLGVEPDPWQAELLNEMAKGTRKLSYRSGHGVGKSSAASWAMIWFLLTRFPVKVVCTSPTSAQLFDALFGEVKKWVQELPEVLQALLETKTDRVYLKAAPNDAWISARTSRAESPEALTRRSFAKYLTRCRRSFWCTRGGL
jgi:phage terminase large subunit